jgi:ATP-binding cassette subfamily C protein CydCD
LRAVGARFHDSAEGLAAANDVFEVLETPVAEGGSRFPAPDPSRVSIALHRVTVEGRDGRLLDRRGAAAAGRTALIVTHRPEQTPGLQEVRLGEERTFDPARPACIGGSSRV